MLFLPWQSTVDEIPQHNGRSMCKASMLSTMLYWKGNEMLLAALPTPQNQNWVPLSAHGTGNEMQFPPPQRSSDPCGIEEMGMGAVGGGEVGAALWGW